MKEEPREVKEKQGEKICVFLFRTQAKVNEQTLIECRANKLYCLVCDII